MVLAKEQRLTDEIGQRQIAVSHDAFYLMELGKVSCVHSLIPEHPVNAEQFGRAEAVVALSGAGSMSELARV